MAGEQFRIQELNPFMEWHLHTTAGSLEVAYAEAKRVGRKTRVLNNLDHPEKKNPRGDPWCQQL
ncbi:hypothetical protein [Synechococcus sp. A15-44]|uniref:hypothetical protein n=1 Tax=Synechococcus sp. A15-44 TaxID=1050646 RepID=UPI0016460CB9|nr:hypothetical protein [Synechococcus sp. A15-44]